MWNLGGLDTVLRYLPAFWAADGFFAVEPPSPVHVATALEEDNVAAVKSVLRLAPAARVVTCSCCPPSAEHSACR